MIALYVRVSSREQVDGYSIGEQSERLQQYAAAMGWEGTRLYVDPGFSGSSLDRPAMQELIADVKAGRISRVVSWKLDRLSRSQRDTLYLIEDVFLPNGCNYVSMTENFDTATPFGRAMLGILSVFAQLERERIKERISIGKDGRAKDGRWHGGGLVPIGYRVENTDLVPDPVEAPQVRECFTLYAKGNGSHKVADILTSKGYQHKYGKWNEASVRAVISNKTYLGIIKWNGEEYPGVHEPLVTQDLFDTVQSIRASRQSVRGPQNRALLSGIIWCKRCGARYFVVDRGRLPYRFYGCHSRCKRNRGMVKDPNCKNDYIREEVLDKMVLDQVRSLVLDPEALGDIATPPARDFGAELDALRKKRDRLVDLYAAGTIDREDLARRIAPLDRQISAVVEDQNRPAPAAEARKAISSFGEYLDSGTKEEARLLVLALIDRIEIDGQDVFIHWKFE